MNWKVPTALRSMVTDDGEMLVIEQRRWWGRRVEITITRDGIQVGAGPRFRPTELELTGRPGAWLELRADGRALIRPHGKPWGPRSALWISRAIADRLDLTLFESWDPDAFEAKAPLREQTQEVWDENTEQNRRDFPLHWAWDPEPPEEEVSHDALILRVGGKAVKISRGQLCIGNRKAPLHRVVAARPLFRDDAGILEIFFDTGQILRLRVFEVHKVREHGAIVRGLGAAIERLADQVREGGIGSAADVPEAIAGLVKPKR